MGFGFFDEVNPYIAEPGQICRDWKRECVDDAPYIFVTGMESLSKVANPADPDKETIKKIKEVLKTKLLFNLPPEVQNSAAEYLLLTLHQGGLLHPGGARVVHVLKDLDLFGPLGKQRKVIFIPTAKGIRIHDIYPIKNICNRFDDAELEVDVHNEVIRLKGDVVIDVEFENNFIFDGSNHPQIKVIKNTLDFTSLENEMSQLLNKLQADRVDAIKKLFNKLKIDTVDALKKQLTELISNEQFAKEFNQDEIKIIKLMLIRQMFKASQAEKLIAVKKRLSKLSDSKQFETEFKENESRIIKLMEMPYFADDVVFMSLLEGNPELRKILEINNAEERYKRFTSWYQQNTLPYSEQVSRGNSNLHIYLNKYSNEIKKIYEFKDNQLFIDVLKAEKIIFAIRKELHNSLQISDKALLDQLSNDIFKQSLYNSPPDLKDKKIRLNISSIDNINICKELIGCLSFPEEITTNQNNEINKYAAECAARNAILHHRGISVEKGESPWVVYNAYLMKMSSQENVNVYAIFHSTSTQLELNENLKKLKKSLENRNMQTFFDELIANRHLYKTKPLFPELAIDFLEQKVSPKTPKQDIEMLKVIDKLNEFITRKDSCLPFTKITFICTSEMMNKDSIPHILDRLAALIIALNNAKKSGQTFIESINIGDLLKRLAICELGDGSPKLYEQQQAYCQKLITKLKDKNLIITLNTDSHDKAFSDLNEFNRIKVQQAKREWYESNKLMLDKKQQGKKIEKLKRFVKIRKSKLSSAMNLQVTQTQQQEQQQAQQQQQVQQEQVPEKRELQSIPRNVIPLDHETFIKRMSDKDFQARFGNFNELVLISNRYDYARQKFADDFTENLDGYLRHLFAIGSPKAKIKINYLSIAAYNFILKHFSLFVNGINFDNLPEGFVFKTYKSPEGQAVICLDYDIVAYQSSKKDFVIKTNLQIMPAIEFGFDKQEFKKTLVNLVDQNNLQPLLKLFKIEADKKEFAEAQNFITKLFKQLEKINDTPKQLANFRWFLAKQISAIIYERGLLGLRELAAEVEKINRQFSNIPLFTESEQIQSTILYSFCNPFQTIDNYAEIAQAIEKVSSLFNRTVTDNEGRLKANLFNAIQNVYFAKAIQTAQTDVPNQMDLLSLNQAQLTFFNRLKEKFQGRQDGFETTLMFLVVRTFNGGRNDKVYIQPNIIFERILAIVDTYLQYGDGQVQFLLDMLNLKNILNYYGGYYAIKEENFRFYNSKMKLDIEGFASEQLISKEEKVSPKNLFKLDKTELYAVSSEAKFLEVAFWRYVAAASQSLNNKVYADFITELNQKIKDGHAKKALLVLIAQTTVNNHTTENIFKDYKDHLLNQFSEPQTPEIQNNILLLLKEHQEKFDLPETALLIKAAKSATLEQMKQLLTSHQQFSLKETYSSLAQQSFFNKPELNLTNKLLQLTTLLSPYEKAAPNVRMKLGKLIHIVHQLTPQQAELKQDLAPLFAVINRLPGTIADEVLMTLDSIDFKRLPNNSLEIIMNLFKNFQAKDTEQLQASIIAGGFKLDEAKSRSALQASVAGALDASRSLESLIQQLDIYLSDKVNKDWSANLDQVDKHLPALWQQVQQLDLPAKVRMEKLNEFLAIIKSQGLIASQLVKYTCASLENSLSVDYRRAKENLVHLVGKDNALIKMFLPESKFDSENPVKSYVDARSIFVSGNQFLTILFTKVKSEDKLKIVHDILLNKKLNLEQLDSLTNYLNHSLIHDPTLIVNVIHLFVNDPARLNLIARLEQRQDLTIDQKQALLIAFLKPEKEEKQALNALERLLTLSESKEPEQIEKFKLLLPVLGQPNIFANPNSIILFRYILNADQEDWDIVQSVLLNFSEITKKHYDALMVATIKDFADVPKLFRVVFASLVRDLEKNETGEPTIALEQIATFKEKFNKISEEEKHKVYTQFQTKPYPSFLRLYNAVIQNNVSQWANQLEKNPFEVKRAQHFEQTEVQRVINNLRTLSYKETQEGPVASNTYISLIEKDRLFSAFQYIHFLGKGFSETRTGVSNYSKDQLQQAIENCRREYKQFQQADKPDAKKGLELKLRYLALAREAMFRSTGQFPNSTQIIAIIKAILEGNNQLAQIATGEGKSIVTALFNIMQQLEGGHVEACTSDLELAKRDAKDFAPFYQYLGIPSAVLTKQSHFSEMKANGIHYTTFAELALFRKKHQQLGRRFVGRASLTLDEADYSFLNDKTVYRYAKVLEEDRGADNQSTKIWLYELINEFIDSEQFKDPEKRFSEQDDIINLKNFLIEKCSQDPGRIKFIENVSPDQLNSWIEAANEASKRKENEHFRVITKPEMVNGQIIMTSFAAIINSTNQRVEENSEWGNGIHQFLHARLNKQNEDLPKQERRPAFRVSPEKIELAAATCKNIIDEYRVTGLVWGLTGTVGSAEEIQECQEKFGLNAYNVPSHYIRQRVDLSPILAKDQNAWIEKTWIQIKTNLLKHTPPQSVLLICENIKSSEIVAKELHKRFLADTDLQDILKKRTNRADNFFQLYNETNKVRRGANLAETFEHEKEVIAAAGLEGMITVSTQMLGRGTNIQPKSPSGLFVIQNYIDSKRNFEQGEGRAGRQGAQGGTLLLLHEAQLGKHLPKLKQSHPQFLAAFKEAVEAVRKDKAVIEKRDRILRETAADVMQFYDNHFVRLLALGLDPSVLELIKRDWSMLRAELDKQWARIVEEQGQFSLAEVQKSKDKFIDSSLTQWQGFIVNAYEKWKKHKPIDEKAPPIALSTSPFKDLVQLDKKVMATFIAELKPSPARMQRLLKDANADPSFNYLLNPNLNPLASANAIQEDFIPPGMVLAKELSLIMQLVEESVFAINNDLTKRNIQDHQAAKQAFDKKDLPSFTDALQLEMGIVLKQMFLTHKQDVSTIDPKLFQVFSRISHCMAQVVMLMKDANQVQDFCNRQIDNFRFMFKNMLASHPSLMLQASLMKAREHLQLVFPGSDAVKQFITDFVKPYELKCDLIQRIENYKNEKFYLPKRRDLLANKILDLLKKSDDTVSNFILKLDAYFNEIPEVERTINSKTKRSESKLYQIYLDVKKADAYKHFFVEHKPKPMLDEKHNIDPTQTDNTTRSPAANSFASNPTKSSVTQSSATTLKTSSPIKQESASSISASSQNNEQQKSHTSLRMFSPQRPVSYSEQQVKQIQQMPLPGWKNHMKNDVITFEKAKPNAVLSFDVLIKKASMQTDSNVNETFEAMLKVFKKLHPDHAPAIVINDENLRSDWQKALIAAGYGDYGLDINNFIKYKPLNEENHESRQSPQV